MQYLNPEELVGEGLIWTPMDGGTAVKLGSGILADVSPVGNRVAVFRSRWDEHGNLAPRGSLVVIDVATLESPEVPLDIGDVSWEIGSLRWTPEGQRLLLGVEGRPEVDGEESFWSQTVVVDLEGNTIAFDREPGPVASTTGPFSPDGMHFLMYDGYGYPVDQNRWCVGLVDFEMHTGVLAASLARVRS